IWSSPQASAPHEVRPRGVCSAHAPPCWTGARLRCRALGTENQPKVGCGMREPRRTTETGYVNRNGQVVLRDTGLPGTDHGQKIYVLRCPKCETEYGANGSDIFQRKCPTCQGGAPGLEY